MRFAGSAARGGADLVLRTERSGTIELLKVHTDVHFDADSLADQKSSTLTHMASESL